MAALSRLALVLALAVTVLSFAAPAGAERAGSTTRTFQAGQLEAGLFHTCAILDRGALRCWGGNADGQLGYGNTTTIGDDELPAVAGPVDLGAGRTATAVALGQAHTCAILDDSSIRCWGRSGDGQLGYGNANDIGDDETPGSVGPVNLGPGRTAVTLTAGSLQTCAILDDGTVRCWGSNAAGQLGYPGAVLVGDDETPGSVGPVNLGPGRTAVAITAGSQHTCAILDDGTVRCWGFNGNGQLGYPGAVLVGDDETPGSVGPVNLGPGRTAVAIAAGEGHTCAILDDRTLRCWGFNGNGQLGYGIPGDIADPSLAGPVNLGPGRTAVTVAASGAATCAMLDDGAVRCWGPGNGGTLGYGNTTTIGDDETPAAAGPVNLGLGRTAVAIATGASFACAALDDGTLRCWGSGTSGRLGYGNADDIGDDEVPAAAGPVSLGGTLVATAADLSVAVGAGSGSVVVGANASFTVTLRNAGPDPAVAPQLLVTAAGATLVSATPSAGSFDAARGIWQPGTLAAGATSTLTLVERATTTGALVVSAEVIVAPTRDPDSAPANFRASEDDQASATTTVTAAPAPPPAPAPAPPAAPGKATPDRLTLRLAAAADTTAPHVFAASGRLVLTGVPTGTACTGSVTLTAKAGPRTLASKTAALKLKDGACEYAGKLTISAKARKTAKSAKVTAAFAGNDTLLAATSKAATARLA